MPKKARVERGSNGSGGSAPTAKKQPSPWAWRRRLGVGLVIVCVSVPLFAFAQSTNTSNNAESSLLGAIASSSVAATPGSDQTTTPSPTTSTVPATTPPGKPVTFALKTTPTGATASLRLADGSLRTLTAPFSAVIPSGTVELTLSLVGYNTRTERLLIGADAQVQRWLDPAGQLIQKRFETKTGSNPKQVTFTPDGQQMWVSLLGARGVEVFDTNTGAKLDLIRLGTKGGSVEVIFNKDGSRAYASQMESGSVYEIDTKRRVVLRNMPTGGQWTKILLLTPDEKTLFAANWTSDDVSEIDLASGKVRRKLKTVRTPRGLTLSPTGDRLFVAGFENGDIERINLATGDRKVLIRTGGAMRHISADPKKGVLFVDDMATAKIHKVDMATEEVTVFATTDSHPNTMDLGLDGSVLFVSNRGENGASYYLPGPEWGTVTVFDASTGRLIDGVVSGNQTTGLDVSEDGRLLAFTDFLDNRLSVYELPTAAVLLKGSSPLVAAKPGQKSPHQKSLTKTNYKGQRAPKGSVGGA